MKKSTRHVSVFSIVTWSIIAVLIMYISGNIGGSKSRRNGVVVERSNELLGCYFAKNYIAENDPSKIEWGDDEIEGDAPVMEYVDPLTIDKTNEKVEKLLKEMDNDYLKKNFYTLDSSTSVTDDLLNAKQLLNKDVTIMKNSDKPQILLYHTHSHEKYSDSAMSVADDTVIGVGNVLDELLTERGYNVIHDTTSYDVVDGKWNRNAYETALKSLKKILSDNKSIKVTIDIHRNSGSEKEVTTINGVKTARIMFFNGVSRTRTGTRTMLSNPNLKGNLAFSLKCQISAMTNYPSLCKNIYIKGYRYNLHLVERAMLVEVGNDKNTVEEAKNAMEPLADILDDVLSE